MNSNGAGRADRFIATVSQVNRRVSLNLKNDKVLADIYVKGEISNFICHYKSGHVYFTLKDSESALKCVMFSLEAEKLSFEPENGMSIIAKGNIGVYERDGVYQLYVSALEQEKETEEADGLFAAFLKLKEKLEKEGIFSQSREFPAFPEKVCLITSKDGAALQDMLSVFERRYPLLELFLIPAIVQGKSAPASVIKAIKAANQTDFDFIIIARGGGSAEDLWAFNDEALARAIYASRIPVVSAVGHETDFSLSDFAADLRAPTPSAAAELTTPDLSGFVPALENILSDLQQKVSGITERQKLKIERLEKEIHARVKNNYINKKRTLDALQNLINALSPEKVFARGYAAVFNQSGNIIKNTADVQFGEELNIQLADGSLTVVVKNKT
ncbi:MAG: exodeoxyribonuclease VII large subunit [Oscillospiraceae bacterium]|nr:exodeoxyribonuclease VII large subunit [Oscillospiraceae bacterium]